MKEKLSQVKSWLGTGSINIFGLPFSGKDTVGKRLAASLDANFLSSGDIIRTAREQAASAAIRTAAAVSDSGAWMPTLEFKEMIAPYLYAPELGGRALILSAVGRWSGEEQTVLEALKKGHHDTRAVILLNIPEAEIWQRWELARDPDSRNIGRADDSDAAKVARRISEFASKTKPVIETYKNLGLLIQVDGQQSREAVFAEVVEKLSTLSQRATQ